MVDSSSRPVILNLTQGINFIFLWGQLTESEIILNVHFYKFLENVMSQISRLVSYRTKHKITSSSVLLVDR